jgi:starvation-inducible DNA-binding protein
MSPKVATPPNRSSATATRRTRSVEPHAMRSNGNGRTAETQAFDQLREASIGLPDRARADSCRKLNRILADSMVLYALYKKHHWLVGGPTFYQLHLLFDKHAEEQGAIVDLLAERVQSLGGIAVGDPRHAAELTSIERPPDGAEDVRTMLRRLITAHETILAEVREAIGATERSEDWGSNDLLMSDVLRRHELQVWFVSMHLVDEPLVDERRLPGTGGRS